MSEHLITPRSEIRRDLLPRLVRSYADNLTVQLHSIWRQYEVKTFDDFKRLVLEKKIPEPVVRKYCDLIVRLSDVVRSGKLPPEEQERFKLQEAREILGDDHVFGLEQVSKAWNLDLNPEDIPPIPYTREDLEKAKELGEILILRIGHDQEGRPLTLKNLQQMTDEIIDPEYSPEFRNRTLADPNPDPHEDFYTAEPIVTRWVLITPLPLDRTFGRNYGNQTLALLEYLRENDLFASTIHPDQYRRDAQTIGITDVAGKKSAEVLVSLPTNQYHRRTAAEVVYDTMLRYLTTGVRPLQSIYDWTRSTTHGGSSIIAVGTFVNGLGILRYTPYSNDSEVGATCVR